MSTEAEPNPGATIQTRWATREDADFLALISLMAVRSHLPRGTFDLIVSSTEEHVLKYVKAFVVASAPNLFHFSHFRIIEVDSRPAAALCGYDPDKTTGEMIGAASIEAARVMGWTDTERIVANQRGAVVRKCFPEEFPGAWVIENVATLPEYRRRGLVNTLLEEMLQIGESRGHHLAQISVLIGNTPAQRAYEKIGFKAFDEKRHPAFEAAFGSPGMIRMLK